MIEMKTIPDTVVNTWSGDFSKATSVAYKEIKKTRSAINSVEIGCSFCEKNQCDTSVGFGNHPDSLSFTSLDAMIMDGSNMKVGSVAYIRKYRDAISLAKHVMIYSAHTLLVGEGAESFEDMLGILEPKPTTTFNTMMEFDKWLDNNCQPNFYRNLEDCDSQCGPYKSINISSNPNTKKYKHDNWNSHLKYSSENHDTIGMIALSYSTSTGVHMACGTSTNGANHKIAGRVGDSPIAGSGCYVIDTVGGATATGDGDILMRFLPSYSAVTHMRSGLEPTVACETALVPIIEYYPSFSGGLVCLSNLGMHGAAAYNMNFTYSVMSDDLEDVFVITVEDMKSRKKHIHI